MIKRGVVGVLSSVILGLAAVPAQARQDANLGLLLAYPASFGVQINLGDAVSIRPEIGFSFGSTELPLANNLISTLDTSALELGVSAQIYLSSNSGLKTYVSPRFAYRRQSLETDSPFALDDDTTSSGYGVAGLFGVLYQAAPRLSLFGETGVAYDSTSSDAESRQGDSSRFGNRSAVGVVFWF